MTRRDKNGMGGCAISWLHDIALQRDEPFGSEQVGVLRRPERFSLACFAARRTARPSPKCNDLAPLIPFESNTPSVQQYYILADAPLRVVRIKRWLGAGLC